MTDTSLKVQTAKILSYSANCINSTIAFVKKYPLHLIAIAAAYIIALLSFDYIDGITETIWTLNLWDALFEGRILEYSAVTFENARGAPHPGDTGGFIQMLPWAIWNFPLWLMYPTPESGNIDTPGCIIWSKLFLVTCLVVASYLVKKLSMKITSDEYLSDYSFLLCLSAGTAILSIGYAGQNEIVYVVTFLASIYIYIMGHKIPSACLIIYSLGCYPLLVIPLTLLLFVKNYGLIKTFIIAIVGLVLGVIMFGIGGSSTSSSYGSLSTFIEKIFFSTPITMDAGTISLFMVSLVLILFCCIIRIKDYDVPSAIVCVTIFFTTMMMFCWMMFYRYYVCIPAIIISLTLLYKTNRNLFKIGVVLFTLINYLAFLVACRNIYVWDYLSFQGLLSNYITYNYPDNFLWLLFGSYAIIGMDLIYSALIATCVFYLYILVAKPTDCKEIEVNEKLLLGVNTIGPRVFTALYFLVPLVVG